MNRRLWFLLILVVGFFSIGVFLPAGANTQSACGQVYTGTTCYLGQDATICLPNFSTCYCPSGTYCVQAGNCDGSGICCWNSTIYNATTRTCDCPAGTIWSGSSCVTYQACPQVWTLRARTPGGTVFGSDLSSQRLVINENSITVAVNFAGSCSVPQYWIQLFLPSQWPEVFARDNYWQSTNSHTFNNITTAGSYTIFYGVAAPGGGPVYLARFSFWKINVQQLDVSDITASPDGLTASATFSWRTDVSIDSVRVGSRTVSVRRASGSVVISDLELGREHTWGLLMSDDELIPGPPFTTPPRPVHQGVAQPVSGPWFQVKDADVQAAGNLESSIPSLCVSPSCTPEFDLPATGPNGFPGIPAYGGTSNFGNGTVSRIGWGWIANSAYSGRRYDYQFFKDKLGRVSSSRIVSASTDPNFFTDRVSGGTLTVSGSDLENKAGGSGESPKFLVHEGNLTITGTGNTNLGSKGIVIFADGDVNIQGKININANQGFFALFAGGNINIDPAVSHPSQPALEGMFLANGTINTGSKADPLADDQLYIRGSLVAWGGINLARDLDPLVGGNRVTGANNTKPAEFIEYAPDLALRFPKELLREERVWREIAP